MTDVQAQAAALQEKVDKLEELVRSKDEELSKHQNGQDKSEVCNHYYPPFLFLYI